MPRPRVLFASQDRLFAATIGLAGLLSAAACGPSTTPVAAQGSPAEAAEATKAATKSTPAAGSAEAGAAVAPLTATPPRTIAAPAPPPPAKERAQAHFDPATAAAQGEVFREALASGRRAVKGKRYAEGIAALERALAIDPNHASALAELGWALYLSGDLTRAERSTRQAIAAASEERTRGAALYNLGRIHEDRGEADEAALAYRRSLALRPNGVVESRLTTLLAAGAEPVAHECDVAEHRGRPPLDLCAAVVAKLPADPEFTENHCLDSEVTPSEVAVDAAGAVYGGERSTLIALDVGGGIQATTFGVERWMDSGGAITERHLAILFDEIWFTLALGGEYNPGVGYIGESLWVESMTAEDLIPGGRPELLLRIKWQQSDGDYGDNAMESTEQTIVAVVSLEGSHPRWLGAVHTAVVASSGRMLDDEPSEATETRSERAVELRWLPTSGEVEVMAKEGVEPSAPLGRFAIDALPATCPMALPFVHVG